MVQNTKRRQTIKNRQNTTKTKKQREKECVKKLIGKKIKVFDKHFHNTNSQKLSGLQKYKKIFRKILIKTYTSKNCNIGCKGTQLEPGDPSKLPKKYAEQFKNYPKGTISVLEKERKQIFGGKTNVLDEDSFYEKFNKKLKNEYMQSGAVSNCSI